MAHIFPIRPGHVARIDEESPGVPFSVSAEGLDESIHALLTSIGIGGQANVQFMHTLRNLVYIYVFGERVGTMELGGILFRRYCDVSGIDEHGLEQMIDYYNEFGISRRGRPVDVAVGRRSYRGTLLAFQAGITDPTNLVGQFTLRFNYLPDQE